MDRFSANQEFLNLITVSNATERKKLLKQASTENIKSILECVLNKNSIPWKKNEFLRVKSSFRVLSKYSSSKQSLNETKVRVFLVKNSFHLKRYLRVFIPRLVELAIICIYNT